MISANSGDFTTGPINQIAYTTSKASTDPLKVGTTLGVKKAWSVGSKALIPSLQVGQGKSGTTQLYAGSEWKWDDRSTAIFDALKKAYTTNKNASGKWRVMLPVYTQKTAANPTNPWLWKLAQLFSFGPSPAYACVQFTPNIQVVGFTTADVTSVNYNSSCKQCDSGDITCLGSSTSCSRTNNVTFEIQPDSSTVAPPGTSSGGPDDNHITPSGSSGNGTYATTDVKLVK